MANPATPDGKDTRNVYEITETCVYELEAASKDDAEELHYHLGNALGQGRCLVRRTLEVKETGS